MSLCTMPIVNNSNNYISIDNMSDFIIKMHGVYFVGDVSCPFSSPTCNPNQNVKTEFPPGAALVDFVVDMWISTETRWKVFVVCSFNLPGNICYKITGSTSNPVLTTIPCPNNLSC